MSVSIKLYTISKINDSFENHIKEHSENDILKSQSIFVPEISKMSKLYVSTRFVPISYNFNLNGVLNSSNGWFIQHNLDMPVHRDLQPKLDNSPQPIQSTSIAVKLNEAGVFGQFINNIDQLWNVAYETLRIQPQLKNKPKHDLVTRMFSNSAGVKAGQPLQNPIIRMKLDFTKYSLNHPNKALAGKSKTEIFDTDKPIMVDGKCTAYELYKYNGEDININNVTEVISKCTIIKGIMIDISSISAGIFLSIPIRVVKIWIKNVSSGFSNDYDELPLYNDAYPIKKAPEENNEEEDEDDF